ncbi:MAG: hypothetical protein IJ421_00355 [Prevotella sp.]|nr:hypothetical protein [Prevotella sp.]
MKNNVIKFFTGASMTAAMLGISTIESMTFGFSMLGISTIAGIIAYVLYRKEVN